VPVDWLTIDQLRLVDPDAYGEALDVFDDLGARGEDLPVHLDQRVHSFAILGAQIPDGFLKRCLEGSRNEKGSECVGAFDDLALGFG
jgi:hypothetical protein